MPPGCPRQKAGPQRKQEDRKLKNTVQIPKWNRRKGGTDAVWLRFQQEVKIGIQEMEQETHMSEEKRGEDLCEELVATINRAARV